jgi:hypothetical protein
MELNDIVPAIEHNQKMNGPASPVVTIPADVQSSNSPFDQNALDYALSQWQSVIQNQHEEFERREGERKRRNSKLKESYGSDCDAKRL